MSNKTVVEEELTRTTDTDEVMEYVAESLQEYTLSRAEFFYLDCQVKNPKDVWNE